MLVTIAFGALIFFVLLFAIAVVAAVVVIPLEYLAQHVGEAADWRSYLTVGLMASVLGTVAGAVGSGLEDEPGSSVGWRLGAGLLRRLHAHDAGQWGA
jgi:hypothetical protein